MNNWSGAAADLLRRSIYPLFASAWGAARNLTGRRRRLRRAADGTTRAATRRRHLESWNQSHDR